MRPGFREVNAVDRDHDATPTIKSLLRGALPNSLNDNRVRLGSSIFEILLGMLEDGIESAPSHRDHFDVAYVCHTTTPT